MPAGQHVQVRARLDPRIKFVVNNKEDVHVYKPAVKSGRWINYVVKKEHPQ